MERTNYTTGAKWEDIVGYSRAVRIGNVIEVSGTTAVSNGEVVAKGSAFGQARYILNTIEEVLMNLGSCVEDVVRTRIYVTNIKDWEDIAKAHHIFFQKVKPASTMVEVSALIDPEMLVEIEVTAVVEK
ncbi:MAG: RidA family protein [Saprospiraceae bacterium]|nr:RidA family protein [Saprospiraceae bacterium]MCB9325224.1 RidA family protein [Lewinellaceae bacterium]